MPENGITNAQLYDALMDLNKGMGRLEVGLDDVKDHVKSVSGKADAVRKELGDHAKDPEAHGVKAEQRGAGYVKATIGAVLGAIAAAIAIFKFIVPAAVAIPK